MKTDVRRDGASVHHRCEADRGTAIVREAQERTPVRDQAAMQRDAVHRRRHPMLSHSIMHVGAFVLAWPNLDLVLGLRVVGRSQIGGPSQELRYGVEQMVEHSAAGLARG